MVKSYFRIDKIRRRNCRYLPSRQLLESLEGTNSCHSHTNWRGYWRNCEGTTISRLSSQKPNSHTHIDFYHIYMADYHRRLYHLHGILQRCTHSLANSVYHVLSFFALERATAVLHSTTLQVEHGVLPECATLTSPPPYDGPVGTGTAMDTVPLSSLVQESKPCVGVVKPCAA
jgi:hypothetical protein